MKVALQIFLILSLAATSVINQVITSGRNCIERKSPFYRNNKACLSTVWQKYSNYFLDKSFWFRYTSPDIYDECVDLCLKQKSSTKQCIAATVQTSRKGYDYNLCFFFADDFMVSQSQKAPPNTVTFTYIQACCIFEVNDILTTPRCTEKRTTNYGNQCKEEVWHKYTGLRLTNDFQKIQNIHNDNDCLRLCNLNKNCIGITRLSTDCHLYDTKNVRLTYNATIDNNVPVISYFLACCSVIAGSRTAGCIEKRETNYGNECKREEWNSYEGLRLTNHFDIHGNITNVSECFQICQRNNHCVAVSMEKNHTICHLFNVTLTFEENDNWTSNFRACCYD